MKVILEKKTTKIIKGTIWFPGKTRSTQEQSKKLADVHNQQLTLASLGACVGCFGARIFFFLQKEPLIVVQFPMWTEDTLQWPTSAKGKRESIHVQRDSRPRGFWGFLRSPQKATELSSRLHEPWERPGSCVVLFFDQQPESSQKGSAFPWPFSTSQWQKNGSSGKQGLKKMEIQVVL